MLLLQLRFQMPLHFQKERRKYLQVWKVLVSGES